jgi:hypothetical protein
MNYTRPSITDVGSVSGHTYFPVGQEGHFKGGGDPQHLDKVCEWSGGSDIDLCEAPAPGA